VSNFLLIPIPLFSHRKQIILLTQALGSASSQSEGAAADAFNRAFGISTNYGGNSGGGQTTNQGDNQTTRTTTTQQQATPTPTTTPEQNNRQPATSPTITSNNGAATTPANNQQNPGTTQNNNGGGDNVTTPRADATSVPVAVTTTIGGTQVVSRVITPTTGVTPIPTALLASEDSLAQCKLVAVLITYT
jgi:hypothetical protein